MASRTQGTPVPVTYTHDDGSFAHTDTDGFFGFDVTLTSQWEPPSECFRRPFTTMVNPVLSVGDELVPGPIWDFYLEEYTLSCSDPQFRKGTENKPNRARAVGLCPAGYSVVATEIAISSTTARCCPPGFEGFVFMADCPSTSFLCATKITSSDVIALSTSYNTDAGNFELATKTERVESAVAYDHGYIVTWWDEVTHLFTPSGAPLSVLGASLPIRDVSQYHVPTCDPSSSSVDGGESFDTDSSDDDLDSIHHRLTRKAIGGIIGGVLSFVILAVLGIFGYKRRARSKQAGVEKATNASSGGPQVIYVVKDKAHAQELLEQGKAVQVQPEQAARGEEPHG